MLIMGKSEHFSSSFARVLLLQVRKEKLGDRKCSFVLVLDVDSSKLIPVISLLNLSSSFLYPCGYYENYVARSMMCMQIWCTKSVLYGSY